MDREEFERCAVRMKALTDPCRLRMIDRLFQGEAIVSEIAKSVGETISMASHHLSILLNAGIVQYRREGRCVHYSLHPDVVLRKDGELTQLLNLGCCKIDFEPGGPVVNFESPSDLA